MPQTTLGRLYGAIRDVQDFPSPGIVFRDITPLLLDPQLFRQAVHSMLDFIADVEIDKVLAVESRGFLLAAPIAISAQAGLVPARKKGKLPWNTHQIDYALEYGTDTIEIHTDAIGPGDKVLVVDDVLATGGTARAAARAVERCNGRLVGISVLIELAELEGRGRLGEETTVWSVLKYPRA
jgi:adenine phosphoribosyltransferase